MLVLNRRVFLCTPLCRAQALQTNKAGSVETALAAQVLVVCAALAPPPSASQLWAALVEDARFPPDDLLRQAAAELVALSSVEATAAVLQWLAQADAVVPSQAAAFAWDIIQACMDSQCISAAVQACSTAHDAGLLACYQLPVHVPRITTACGGRVRCGARGGCVISTTRCIVLPTRHLRSIDVVPQRVASGVAVVLAWLLRLCHAMQAGKPVDVDTLSVVIRASVLSWCRQLDMHPFPQTTGYANEEDKVAAVTLQQLLVKLCEERPRPLLVCVLIMLC